MEITKREILFSTIIFTTMIGLGILISNPITSGLTQRALEISSAATAKDSLKFGYFKRTNVGLFLAEGELEALNPVSISDIPGEFLEIEKSKEKYTTHTHHHSDGKRHWTTVSHSWDKQGRSETWRCDSIVFLGERFELRDINFHYSPKLDTIIYEVPRRFGANVGDIRYVYRTWPRTTPGLMTGEANERNWERLKFTKDETIQKKQERAEHNIRTVPWMFWIFWVLLTAGAITLFYYFENNWLEDDNTRTIKETY